MTELICYFDEFVYGLYNRFELINVLFISCLILIISTLIFSINDYIKYRKLQLDCYKTRQYFKDKLKRTILLNIILLFISLLFIGLTYLLTFKIFYL